MSQSEAAFCGLRIATVLTEFSPLCVSIAQLMSASLFAVYCPIIARSAELIYASLITLSSPSHKYLSQILK